MVGIVSYGAHIPYHRLSRAEIAKSWGSAPQPGEKAVANYDEDSITMSVAAAMDCTTGVNEQSIGGLFFASTTSPYLEKLAATIVATAVDLPRNILVADLPARSGQVPWRSGRLWMPSRLALPRVFWYALLIPGLGIPMGTPRCLLATALVPSL